MTPKENKSAWPKKDILVYGMFGSDTPEAKRFRSRSMLAMLAFVVLMALGARPPHNAHAWLWPGPGLAFAYIGYEWWRYLGSLDELERRLQVEAMAWTYLVGLACAVGLGALMAMLGWKVSPFLLVMLEPVRGWRLWKLTRRFE